MPLLQACVVVNVLSARLTTSVLSSGFVHVVANAAGVELPTNSKDNNPSTTGSFSEEQSGSIVTVKILYR